MGVCLNRGEGEWGKKKKKEQRGRVVGEASKKCSLCAVRVSMSFVRLSSAEKSYRSQEL